MTSLPPWQYDVTTPATMTSRTPWQYVQVFLRNTIFEPLEEQMRRLLLKTAVAIQRIWKGCVPSDVIVERLVTS